MNTIASDTQALDSSADRVKLHELARILFFQPINTANHCLAIVITLWFLRNIVPLSLLLIWAALMISMIMFWQFFVIRYRQLLPGPESAVRWLRAFPIAGVTLGLGWGSTAWFPGLTADVTSTLFLAIMVIGVVAAGLGVLSPYFRSFAAFAFFALAPYSAAFFLEGGRLFNTLGGMFLLYLFAICLSGIYMHRQVYKTIELRMENADLIDSLKEQNIRAEEARQDAVQANQSKSKFLAAASHDLRQPLHALGLFVDALRSRNQDLAVSELVDNIGLSTESLNDLLNALLDISRLDAGVLEPIITNFPLQPLLTRVRVNSEQQILDKGLQLVTEPCNVVVSSDRNMLERILRNLITNAAQYTDEGSIALTCVAKGDRLSIQVRDTGIGISEEDLQQIFAEFYQVGNPERDRDKGLGLGLAIVARLAELLGHKVHARSTRGEGSEFSIEVPLIAELEEPIEISEDATTPTSLAGLTVLVIDDEKIIRSALQERLRDWDCEVVVAGDAQDAWTQLASGAMNPDIILTDYRLRENQTGVDAVEYLSQRGLPEAPVVIMSGDTASDRLRELSSSGYRVLHKPVSPRQLRSLLIELASESSA